MRGKIFDIVLIALVAFAIFTVLGGWSFLAR